MQCLHAHIGQQALYAASQARSAGGSRSAPSEGEAGAQPQSSAPESRKSPPKSGLSKSKTCTQR